MTRHKLVCVGACLFMIVSAYDFSGSLGEQHVVLDPSREASAQSGWRLLCLPLMWGNRPEGLAISDFQVSARLTASGSLSMTVR